MPYRFVILVKDPKQLKLLKMVSPGFFGDASAALVVCTNLKVVQSNGIIADEAAHLDAGAAAENAVLAAYALGLGASFIKSYSEAAVKRVLEIPEGFRTELIVSLGYPAKDEPRPIKKQKQGVITYVNRYGTLPES
jgi:nitroreductase